MDQDHPQPTTEPEKTGSELAHAAPDPVKQLMVDRMQEQFRQYAGANLRIDEAAFIVVDERGGTEYRCFNEEDAMDLARSRVENVLGIHTVFKRHATVRPPRAEFTVEKAPE